MKYFISYTASSNTQIKTLMENTIIDTKREIETEGDIRRIEKSIEKSRYCSFCSILFFKPLKEETKVSKETKEE